MKPYQIKLPAIIIEKKFSDSDSTVYQLDLPSLNELTDKSHSLMIDGFKVNILSLMLTEINQQEETDLNETGRYLLTMDVQFETETREDRLLSLGFSDANKLNPVFTGYQTTSSPIEEAIWYECWLNSKPEAINLQVDRLVIELLGNWVFLIE